MSLLCEHRHLVVGILSHAAPFDGEDHLVPAYFYMVTAGGGSPGPGMRGRCVGSRYNLSQKLLILHGDLHFLYLGNLGGPGYGYPTLPDSFRPFSGQIYLRYRRVGQYSVSGLIAELMPRLVWSRCQSKVSNDLNPRTGSVRGR